MIVRINPIDLARVSTGGEWPDGSVAGPLPQAWSADARAFELLILSQDEQQQPLSDAFRQHQLRQMIPQAAIALTTTGTPGPAPSTPILLRLDGQIGQEELLPAWEHLVDADGSGRFAFSEYVKSDEGPGDARGAGGAAASVRLVPNWRRLSHVCNDSRLGLERTVRLRLLETPHELLPEVLAITAVDDPRWERLLPECGFFLSTTARLTALHLIVRQMDAAQVKTRVMQRLMAVAGGQPAVF